jgi:AcrR family transcriptional regulator
MRLRQAIETKKSEKRAAIKVAAYRLFKQKGFAETAIDDIVADAGVAKGTFYLYFSNKTEALGEIVAEKSREVLMKALEKSGRDRPSSHTEAVVAFVEEVVRQLGRDKGLLELIYKNLSWGFFKRLVDETERDEALRDLRDGFLECIRRSSDPERDPEKVLFIILELASAICYSAIILKEPAGMNDMLPLLLDSVRRVVA